MLIAEILIFAPLDRSLSYEIPENLRFTVLPGSLVEVIVGKSKKMGLVSSIKDTYEKFPYIVKPILNVAYDLPITNKNLIQLYHWISEYYACDLYSVIDAAIPAVVRKNIPVKLVPFLQLARDISLSIDAKKLPRQYDAFEFLKKNPYLSKSEFLNNFSRDILEALLKKNVIYETFQREERIGYSSLELLQKRNENVTLTQEQQQVTFSIKENLKLGAFKVHLLHGVTGSGKTEIYIELIREVIQSGGSVLYLLPELALTAQVVEKLRSRFDGMPVLVWHSGLSDGERRDAWLGALERPATIIVGARSAVFLPINNLKLIIVDEEHEASYKQGDIPRYHGRDVAIYRAKIEKAICILGSATPSIESYFNITHKNYQLEKLPQRIDQRQLPVMHVVDMRYEMVGHYGILSRLLRKKIEERLLKREQTILFLNRRGYAVTVLCKNCNYIASCPHCSVPLTYHKSKNLLICHFCSYQEAVHTLCPKCGSKEIFYNGTGTQRVEQSVQEIFPQSKIARIDSDIMGKKYEFIRILNQFRAGEIDILIGTQMIAKGLDFPNVTLVGLINADGSLNQLDFRANERTFQLLVQVAGRSGRGKIPGEVVVQTHIPGNETIFFAKNTDYESFIQQELEVRKTFGYPPYRHIINLHISSVNAPLAKLFGEKLAENLNTKLKSLVPGIDIRGPIDAPIEKIQDRFRFSILIFAPHVSKIARELLQILKQTIIPPEVILSKDVDALDFS